MAVPECPRHHRSRVVRAGWYGAPGNRRQRWWCYPKSGQRHRFTEPLPRVVRTELEGHVCDVCASRLDAWEGQPAPRLYGFTAQEVAAALVKVAGGSTYRAAADWVRGRAHRPLSAESSGLTPKRKRRAPANRHGQLVSDWVSVFAPVIWEHYLSRMPTSRWLLIDEKVVMFHDTALGKSRRAFVALVAMGQASPYDRPRVVAVEAVRSDTKTAWAAFLKRCGATPEFVVGDGGRPLTAASSVFGAGTTQFRRCHWHLKQQLLKARPASLREDPTDPLNSELDHCLDNRTAWNVFALDVALRHAKNARYGGLHAAVARVAPVVHAQLAVRGPGPYSSGPVEAFGRYLDGKVRDRAHGLTNKHRTTALLMLLAADYNGWADETQWAAVIRDHLNTRKGTAAPQRRHVDPRRKPSLRH